MTGVKVVQGRELSDEDIGQIQGLLAEYPDWGRTRLSEEPCRRWDWRDALSRISETVWKQRCQSRNRLLTRAASGLDIDALKIVANGVNGLRAHDRAMIIVTH